LAVVQVGWPSLILAAFNSSIAAVNALTFDWTDPFPPRRRVDFGSFFVGGFFVLSADLRLDRSRDRNGNDKQREQ
jgi:hypothetical protein